MCHTPIDIRATGALSQQFDVEIPLLLLEQLEPFFSNLTCPIDAIGSSAHPMAVISGFLEKPWTSSIWWCARYSTGTLLWPSKWPAKWTHYIVVLSSRPMAASSGFRCRYGASLGGPLCNAYNPTLGGYFLIRVCNMWWLTRTRRDHKYWTPPSGKYLPHIAPPDAMVIHFWVRNWVMALWNCCSKASVQKARNGPSTQLIGATSCVDRSNATMKAEELSSLKLPITKEARQKVGGRDC